MISAPTQLAKISQYFLTNRNGKDIKFHFQWFGPLLPRRTHLIRKTFKGAIYEGFGGQPTFPTPSQAGFHQVYWKIWCGDILFSTLKQNNISYEMVVVYMTLAIFSSLSQLKDDLQTFSLEAQQCSNSSLKKIMSSYHVVSSVTAGILALCEEVSV